MASPRLPDHAPVRTVHLCTCLLSQNTCNMGPDYDDQELLSKIICGKIIRSQVPAITTNKGHPPEVKFEPEMGKSAQRPRREPMEALGSQEAHKLGTTRVVPCFKSERS